jgi:2-polyprenyl-6-methoxyphenol hydroxylase-like FAD-dependent oxidoreductase
MTTTTDARAILIVGAGPVGLTMACELARHGAPCRIIDKEAAPSATSKALAIFPRTLEVFETMGVAERILSAGLRLRGISIHNQREGIARIDLASVQSPYPFVVSLPQSETERILIEHLASFGVTVERERELTGLTQTDTSVCAVIRAANGRQEKVETPWLLGCDGAHSATRHALGMEFEGAPYDESFVLADVKVDAPLSKDEAHLFFSDEGIFAIIAFSSERSRVIANIPAASRDQNLADLTLEEIQTLADRRGPAGMRLSDPVWMARFHISHRKVGEFRRLRVFLAGDAAHIHSPAGGQGMNTGIQDAFNLAWKIALVVSGRAAAQLLASYNIEREPVARGVLNLTDRITRMATVRNPVIQTVRNILLPVVSGVDFFEEKIADRLAELAVNYRHSPIVENHGSGRPRAGDRAPDAELRDENGRARRLFELFREPRHVLLLFLGSSINERKELEALRGEFDDSLGDFVRLYCIVRGCNIAAPGDLLDISGTMHALYQTLAGGIVLVRPDGYIAFRSNGFDSDLLLKYLERIFTGDANRFSRQQFNNDGRSKIGQ